MVQRRLLIGLLAGSVLWTAACDNKGLSYGDANSIIAVMSSERWGEVEPDVQTALEPTIYTVGEEKAFTVTYQEPYGEYWAQLRRFQNMLLVGTAADPWIQEAVDEADEPFSDPGIHQVRDVWALGQTVTVLLLPESGGDDFLRQQLTALHELLDRQYLNFARNRMYTSGIDSALADTLRIEAGFSFLLPEVYRWYRQDSTYVFRNDNPDPSELIREIVVTWRSPAPTSLSPDELLAWRAQMVETHYSEPQAVRTDAMFIDTEPFLGHPAVRVQAQWLNPPELGWPAGGPFITYGLTCVNQDRTYFIDAWLYAPGKEKYEYMIQLETILGTFTCDG